MFLIYVLLHEVQALEEKYAEAEAALVAAGEDADAMQDALNRMAELQTKLDAADATAVERKVMPPNTTI